MKSQNIHYRNELTIDAAKPASDCDFFFNEKHLTNSEISYVIIFYRPVTFHSFHLYSYCVRVVRVNLNLI